MRTTPLVRRAALVAVATGFVAVSTATATSASEESEVWPEHGHLLVIGVEETEDGMTYRHCVEVADGRALPLHSHHDHFHRGAAGDALRRAGNFPVPMDPITPFVSCADFAEMMGS